jgi:signal transduction histidine kinase
MTAVTANGAEELRAARARLVAAADGERHRIERALHDGVQQDLIAVTVRLQLVRQLAGADLPAALDLLGEIERDVREALDRVQSLANGVYPSLLESRGLPDALRSAATASALSATVEAQGVGRHPPAVEEAVYFCCRGALEALAGTGARVTIRVREQEHALRLEIEAAGLDPAAERLLAAADRIEALGGSVSAGPAGLVAAVPLAASPPTGRGSPP